MPTRVAVALSLSVLLLGVGANTGAAESAAASRTVPAGTTVQPSIPGGSAALAALQRALASGSRADLVRSSTLVLRLPRSAFTDAQWAARLSLFRSGAARIANAAAFRVDVSLWSPLRTVTREAFSTASSALVQRVNPRFLDDLAEVTKEATISLACGRVLDVLAPVERPFVQGEGESDIQDVFEEALTKLGARWGGRASVVRVIDWAYYGASLSDDADQFLASTNAYSTWRFPYLVGRPPVSRALWVYVRTCYSPPRMP